MITEGVLNALRCPRCRSSLTPGMDGSTPAGEELRCIACAQVFPIIGGVPRMADVTGLAREVAKSFGFQWRARFGRLFERNTLYGLSAEEERQAFFEAMGIRPEGLTGKMVLDAGCGDGFLLGILGQYPAEIVGIDINTSIEIPRRRCIHLANVTVLQADIFAAPFVAASFDYVWCEGVLPLAEDPRKGFQALSDLVKPGGRLYIWVYPSENLSIYQHLRDLFRVAHMLPRWFLLPVCYGLALPLSLARRVLRPHAHRESLASVAFALFDNLSPHLQKRHTVTEVRTWFEEAGFSDLKQTGLVGMSGTRMR